MIISYQTDSKDQHAPKYNGKSGQAAVDEVINDINTALLQRVAQAGQVVNQFLFQLLPPTPDNEAEPTSMLNAGHGGLKDIVLYFSQNADTGGFYPLQGISAQGLGDEGATLGIVSDECQKVAFDLSLFKTVGKINVYYSQAASVHKEDEGAAAYGRRIIGLSVMGMKDDGEGVVKTYFPPEAKTKWTQEMNNNLDNIVNDFPQFVLTLNELKSSDAFVVGGRQEPMNLELVRDGAPWRQVVDFTTAGAVGASSSYLSNLTMLTAVRAPSLTFKVENIKQVNFLLPYEQIELPSGEAASYEIDYQAGNSEKNVMVVDKSTGRTISIPSLSLSLLGVSGSVGSPLSTQESMSKSKTDETSSQTTVAEKFTVSLPSSFYRLTNFTDVKYGDALARIQVVNTGQQSTDLTVPLGDKVILAKDVGGVAQAVIAAI